MGRGRLRFPTTPRQLRGLDKSLHANRVMITCDRGGRRLAFASYMYGTARVLPAHLFLLPPLSQFLLRLGVMAPIRRFSAAEKGKAPREGSDPLPPKKRPALRGRDEE